MSSRLQVGGLALVVDGGMNTGKIVELVEHHPVVKFDDGDTWENCWLISSRELINVYFCSQPQVIIKASSLKPIGDQQTQDELHKEQEELTCKN